MDVYFSQGAGPINYNYAKQIWINRPLQNQGFYFIFFKLNYILLFMLLHLSQFFPCLPPLLQTPLPPLPEAVTTLLSMFMHVLWLLHSLLQYLHPHEFSVTTNLYYLIPSPFLPILPLHLASIKTLSVSMILLLFCFVYFVFQIQLLIDTYLLPFYSYI